jgi:type 1 glutamine amidotransferase
MRTILFFLLALVSIAKAQVPFTEGAEAVKTKVLIVGGGSSHDFEKWFHQADQRTLEKSGAEVKYTEESGEAAALLPWADVLVMSTNKLEFDTPEFRAALKKFADEGHGVVLLHPAVWYNWAWLEYNRDFVGGGSRAHDPLGPFIVKIVREHPVTKGLPKEFQVKDELYHVLTAPDGKDTDVLAETEPGKFPSVWLVKHPKARIVCVAPGHDGEVHELAEFQTLLLNAVNWTAGKD